MNKKELFQEWGPLVGVVIWAIGIAAWANLEPMKGLNGLIVLAPAFLWVGFAALAAALVWAWPQVQTFLNGIPRRLRWAALLIAGGAAVLVGVVAPRTHRIFYDEDIYEVIGLDIAYSGHAGMINDGGWRFDRLEVRREEYNKEPNGWPFLINLANRVAGIGEGPAFETMHLLFFLSVLLLFGIGTLVADDPVAGLCGAACYALIPENVQWFSTVAAEPATAAMATLAIFALLVYRRSARLETAAFAVCALAFAVQFRPESIALGAAVLLYLLIAMRKRLTEPKTRWMVLLFLLLVSAHLLHLYFVRDMGWGTTGSRFSLQFLRQNILANTVYYVDNKRFPAVFTALALLGLFAKGRRSEKVLIGAWFLVGWLPFLFFYAGSYRYGADVRYALVSLPPLAIFSGCGLAFAWHWIAERWGGRGASFLAAATLAGVLLAYLPTMRAFGEEAWMCRDDHDAAEDFAKLVPPDGLILTHNPNMFIVWGKNAAQMSFLSQAPVGSFPFPPEFMGKVYFHWNYWCNVADPLQKAFATKILESFDCQLVKEEIIRKYRYALYQVGPRKGAASVAKPRS